MKIGILTYHYSNNYGALLQAFALSRVLRDLGHEPIIINRSPKIEFEQNKLKKFLEIPLNAYFNRAFYNFRKQFLPNISAAIELEKLKDFSKSYDAFIVGSDQVWRMDYTVGLGLNNFLDFAPDDKLRISYAASFGKDYFINSGQDMQEIKRLINRFHAISVRESSGIEICKNLFNVNAERLLDPCLLLNQSDYEQVIEYSDRQKGVPKSLTQYLLDSTPWKMELVQRISNKYKIEINNIYKKSNTQFSFRKPKIALNQFKFKSFAYWLNGFKNAEFIVTDSFHGVAFSILYNKQFICIGNIQRGLSRMKSLLDLFNLPSRLILENEPIDNIINLEEIDYAEINKILNEERLKSINFLITHLKTKK